MADFELLAPGGHQKLVDEVVDRLDLKADIDALSPLLTAGAALGITGDGTDSAAWLQRVSTSDGPTTIRSIHGNTIVQDGELLSVNIEGIATEDADGNPLQSRTIPAGTLRSAGTVYDELTATERITRVGVVDLGTLTWTYDNTYPTPFFYALLTGLNMAANSVDMVSSLYTAKSGFWGTAGNDMCVASGGTYLNVSNAAYTDPAAFKAAMDGVYLFYELATYTTTPIDPPLNMTYRTETGGTERVIVPTGENSAPPTLVTAQGYTAESLRDAALSAIAPVENGRASANYGVGSYLVHAGQLCKVTTAIATGESISIGTNVTATTVMAEVIALIAQ